MMKIGRRALVAGGLAGATAIVGVTMLNFPAAGPTHAASSGDGDFKNPLGDLWLGDEKAPVTIIEYASATCPHCANFHTQTFPLIKSEYIETGKVRFSMREFPFDDLSLAAFMLARCVPAGKHHGLIDTLFEQQKTWTSSNPRGELLAIAKFAGMSNGEFDACLKNEELAAGIIKIRDHARDKLKVGSTPTFFINGSKLSGNQPISVFRERINALL